MASRAVGEGGRGAGFIVCATAKGIVGMLHEDTTGPINVNEYQSICSYNSTYENNPSQ